MTNTETALIKRIGERVREARIANRMSQSDLAEKAHLSLSLISDIELGKTRMFVPTFYAVAEALQVSSDYLLNLNSPSVSAAHESKFAELLSDCSPDEIEAIIRVVTEVKTAFRTKSE